MKNSSQHIVSAALSSLALICGTASAQIINENFEDGVLDPRITVSTIGTFSSAAGFKSFATFGSLNAYGFGRSTNRFNSFGNFATILTISFPQPTLVGTLSFREMEIFENWGSGGYISIDGALVNANTSFGRLPYNDRVPDSTFRTVNIPLNRSVSQIVLTVNDITDLSEIYIDDLTISAVPEPLSYLLLALGVPFVLASARHRRELIVPSRGDA